MRHYYVVNASFSFGFAGFLKKAYTTEAQALEVKEQLYKRRRDVTSCDITEVDAKNKKEAESDRPSMFAGPFKGMDGINI